MKNTLIAGCTILAVYIIIAIFAPVIAPFDPSIDRGSPFLPPSAQHILGTNDIGRDIFSELLIGTRLSLLVGFTAAVISLVIGGIIGGLSGWFGGAIDGILSAITTFVITIPFFPIVIILSAIIGGGTLTPALILGLLDWPETARILRAQTISLKSRQYILDIKAMGAGSGYILSRHVSRDLLPFCAYRFILSFRNVVLAEATLSFLGLGSPLAISFGNMLFFAQARHAFLTGTWIWWALPPGLALVGLVFGLLLISLYFEKVVDPRL